MSGLVDDGVEKRDDISAAGGVPLGGGDPAISPSKSNGSAHNGTANLLQASVSSSPHF